MKFLKKSIAFLLAVCMLLSYMPMHVHAAGSTSGTGFYKIVHLDAGRKYISVDVVKKYIDAMAQEGYNQLTLYFSDNQGFRFKLDDMSLTVNGTDYTSRIESAIGNGYNQPADGTGTGDWFRHSLEPDGTKNYYTEADMTEIITYANSKGIDLVPAFDMPGHMGAILEVFTEFRYTGSSTTSWSTLDVDNETARAFALALLQKYVDFFAEADCDYFSICADEFCYDTGAGNIKSTTLANIMLFMDEAAQMIDEAGMVPRCFNDWLYSSTAYTPSAAYGKYEVYYWGNRGYATPDALIAKGHKIINTGEAAYYALGSNWYSEAGTDAGVKAFDPYVIATKSGSFDISNPAGVCFAIWCDRGYFDANTANTGAQYEPAGGDGGKILFTETEGYLRLFAQSVKAKMPEPVTVSLTVGQEYDTVFGPYTGALSAEDISNKLGLDGVLSASSISVTPATGGGLDTSNALTSLTAGSQVVLGDGTNFLVNNNGTLSVGTVDNATKWDVVANGGSFDLVSNGKYLTVVDGGAVSLGNSAPSTPFTILNGVIQHAWWPNQQVSVSGLNSAAAAYGVVSGTPASTTFKLTGAAAGSVSFNYNGTDYTFNVTAVEHTCDSNVAATCIKGASCSVCGAQQSTALDANNHAGPVGTATCASGAVCDACKKAVGEPDTTNHTGGTEVRGAVAATATTEGYTGDTYCLGCNNKIKTGETIPVIVGPVAVSCSCSDHTVTVTANNLTELICGGARVDEVTVAGAAHTVAYNLTPKTASGNYTGSATVSVPVPSGWDTNKIFAFVVNSNGSITRIDATVADDRVTYTCPHFSTTGVAEEITANYNINIDYSANHTVSSETIDGQLAANGTTGNTDNGLASYRVDVTEIPATGGAVSGDYLEFSWSTNYTAGDLILYDGNVYKAVRSGTPWSWPAVNSTNDSWEYIGPPSSSGGEPTYTTVVTFTATGTNGVDTVTIGGKVFKVTVTGGTDPDVGGDTCEHNWVAGYNETHHYEECSICHEKRNEATHNPGVGNCVEAAFCTCGQQVAAIDPNNHKPGTDVLKGYVAATETTDGYSGDYHCQHCDAVKRTGTVIPATGGGSTGTTESVTMVAGGTQTLELDGHIGTNGATGNTANSLASYTVTHTTASSVAEWDSTKEYWGNDQVVYNGKLYQASYWTRGETPGQADVWKLVSDAPAGSPKTVITFTAGANPGTDTATIGTVTVNLTINCSHTVDDTKWEVKFDENKHWHECSVCRATKDEAVHNGGTATCRDRAVCKDCGQPYGEVDANGHTGGTATCQAPANCALCGESYGTVDAHNHVGPMTDVEGTYVAPTDDTDGKEADQICGACSATVTGAVIPALNSTMVEITVATGKTVDKFVDNANLSGWTGTDGNPDTSIATITIDYTAADPGGKLTQLTSWSGNASVIVGGGTYWLVYENGTFSVTNDSANATVWTLEDNNGSNFGLKAPDGSGYLEINDGGLGIGARDFGQDSLILENGAVKSYGWPNKFISCAVTAGGQTTVGTVAASEGVGLYSISQPTNQNSTIHFTGVTPGTTYATIGGTRYKINVVDASLTEVVLDTPAWMTNREVSGFLNDDGSASSFAEQITAADHVSIVTENGVALTDVVPNEATTVADATTDSHAIFWRGMRHASGQVQGTSTDFHQVGDEINYVRYYNGVWQGSADRSSWLDLAGYTLDLYYLQETAVTKEVITEVVDWGEDYNQGLGWEASTYVLLDFAVALDGVGRHPALDGYPNDGDGTTVENQKTIAFHCTHTSDDKTMAKDGTWQRRVDSIFAEETGLYEVYMITITRTSDTPTIELPGSNSNECGSYSYDGTERIIWTIDEATFTEKFGQTTTDGKVLGAFDLRPAGFDITNKDAKSVMYRTVGGDPIVDYVQIYENQGLLVTYYVRAKRTEDSLTVHYRVEGTDTDFHNYYIAVEQGRFFNDGFAASETHAGGLVNNTVTNFYGNTHTVNSDLTKLFDVPAQYRTGLYQFNYHVQLVLDDGRVIEDEDQLPAGRSIKEVILYYQVDNIHYVPIDYAHPVPITNEFFQHHVKSGTVVSASLTRYPASGPSDAYGVYRTTDKGTIYLLDTVMRGSGDAFTFNVDVEVPNNSGGVDRVTETHQVVLVPATTVDYDGFYLIQNSSGWLSYGSRNETQSQQALCYKDDGAVNFGYDDVNKDLLGPTTHGMSVISTTAGSSLTFGFTGTGFDLRAHCTSTSGQIMVLVRDADTDALVRLSMVDTRIMSGSTQGATQYGFTAAFNVPVISILGLPHGNYSVQVNHIANTTYVDEYEKDENGNNKLDENGKPIVNRVPVVRPLTVQLTGFRIYNTMLSTDYATGGVAAGDIYTSEKDPTFVELRDVALAGVYVKDSYAGHEDQIYADQIADNVMSQVHATGRESIQALVIGQYTSDNLATSDPVKVDIIDNGPKNEIYLWPGQALAIGCSTTISAQIGLRSVDGSPVSFELDDVAKTLNTSTDMYYVVNGSDGMITVENTGSSGVLAVTTLKSLAVDYTPDIEPLSMPKMMMFFRARGFAESAPVKEGIVEEDGKKYYYVDGEKNYAGLIEIDGSYYYVRTSGEIVCGKSYWVTKTNGLVEAGFYTFGADGKMENCTIGANGIVEENGVKYYYVDGVKTYAGLIEIDGDYYYVRSSGEVVCGKTYWTTKTNGLMDANNYTFGADGKMINPPTNGIVEENGRLFYYENGKKTYAGLIEIDGSYYYVRSSGEVVCNRSYYISKSNDLMPLGNYTFGADGKMIMN